MSKSLPETELGHPAAPSAHPPYAPVAEVGPVTAESDPVRAGHAPATAPEELDVWWGSYSGWTMAPSWAACVLLTGLIAWGAWVLVPRGFVQGTVLGLAGGLWLAQGFRWAYRVFGYNYRLTNRRLYRDRGFLYTEFAALDLAAVASVVVKRSGADRLVGVGQVWVVPEDKAKGPLVLEGVGRPLDVAQAIREAVHAAREPTKQPAAPR
jgi:hypothetical protein